MFNKSNLEKEKPQVTNVRNEAYNISIDPTNNGEKKKEEML